MFGKKDRYNHAMIKRALDNEIIRELTVKTVDGAALRNVFVVKRNQKVNG